MFLENFYKSSSLIPYNSVSNNANLDTSQAIIRHAYIKDISKLAEILTYSFYPPRGIVAWIAPLLKLGICEDLRTRLNSQPPYYVCLVASLSRSQEQEVVGTTEVSLRSSSFWSTVDSQYAYISNLAVKDSYRRMGIARQLLLQCEQIALEWGFAELFLHVLEDNEKAKQLYFSSGYQLKEIESNWSGFTFYRPRRLLLSKKLDTKNFLLGKG